MTEMTEAAAADVGYRQENIDELVRNDRFVAAVHAYALDYLTLGQTMVAIAPFSPDQFKFNPAAYARLIQEVARRILAGTLATSTQLSEKYPEIYAGRIDVNPINNMRLERRFSEFEALPAEINPLVLRRESFTEDDIQELSKNPRLLACTDSYQQGLIDDPRLVLERAFGRMDYAPRLLDLLAFRDLINEMVRRISRGEIIVPPSSQTDYAFAYIPESTRDDPRYC